jgi:integrase/recombinase XerD
MFMADSGTRRQETINLNWGDVDIQSGLVRVARGKGGKARSVVIGATTRRALLKYRRTVPDHTEDAPLFQAKGGGRFTGKGFREIFVRLSKRSGIQVNAHSLRRTWAILCLRAGMDVLNLQALGGWADLTMVKHYAQIVDDDLLQAHKKSSPIDYLDKLQKK